MRHENKMDRLYICSFAFLQAAVFPFVVLSSLNIAMFNSKTQRLLLSIAFMVAEAFASAGVTLVDFSNTASTVKVSLTDGWRFMKADDPSAPDNLTQGEMRPVQRRLDL